ncbi:glycerol-3-phosphate 1-O-acyltransferase PlsY [Methylovirgula sp. 4M-Z18]|nr:glycerol-3-phosphate 1-O-acyltransferase PlsY [Methylovirgula sp. 4M-Z18]
MASTPVASLLAALVIGYLCGSIPFGLIITRLAGTQDIRTIGSGNIGATNVLRTGRKELAAATLLLDMLKGTVAVLITGALFGTPVGLFAAIGAFLGHLFPVWLSFKGGKGVATYLGCLLGVYWPVALCFAAIWVGVAYLSRYSSLSALTATLCSPILLWLFGPPASASLFALLSILLWWKHHENIARLRAGTEGRIGQKG